jgi:hypothetical protein
MKQLSILTLAAVRVAKTAEDREHAFEGVVGGLSTAPLYCWPSEVEVKAFERGEEQFPQGVWTERRMVSVNIPDHLLREWAAGRPEGVPVPEIWGVAISALRRCGKRKGLGGVTVDCFGGPVQADTEQDVQEYAYNLLQSQFPAPDYHCRRAGWCRVPETALQAAWEALQAREKAVWEAQQAEVPAPPAKRAPRVSKRAQQAAEREALLAAAVAQADEA